MLGNCDITVLIFTCGLERVITESVSLYLDLLDYFVSVT